MAVSWRMRRWWHVARLNWGQVSLHQALSGAFDADFYDRLNHVKLERNTRARARARATIVCAAAAAPRKI